MWKSLELELNETYKFTLGWGRSECLQSEIIGKVINIRNQPYSESFCVVNDKGLIYLWNVPLTRIDLPRIIHKVEKV